MIPREIISPPGGGEFEKGEFPWIWWPGNSPFHYFTGEMVKWWNFTQDRPFRKKGVFRANVTFGVPSLQVLLNQYCDGFGAILPPRAVLGQKAPI